jgi:sulfite reductase (NADPH) flavoprotein alpha-component
VHRAEGSQFDPSNRVKPRGVDNDRDFAQSSFMARSVLILYATASGNAGQLAEVAAERLQAVGYAPVVVNVADFSVVDLAGVATALVIASTWGHGRPPPDAEEFCAALHAPGKPNLAGLSYAVLALGSRSYPEFCWCGRMIDEDLARHGARRLLPRVECDTKYKTDFEGWMGALAKVLPPAS